MGRAEKVTIVCLIFAATLDAAQLEPRTVQAFDDYVRRVEARLDAQSKSSTWLWADQSPGRRQQVQAGQILAESVTGKNPLAVPDGLIHDWIGAVFMPGTTLEKTLALVQDYDRHKLAYSPEVVDSRLLSRNGNDFKIYLRLKKKKVMTVVLDTYYDVHYLRLDDKRWGSRSYGTRIQEVENAGKKNERLLPPGDDHGFLWRLDSYWRFAERDGGVWMECEAVSLTRDIPTGFNWLVVPIIRDLPHESLVNTLRKTREALAR